MTALSLEPLITVRVVGSNVTAVTAPWAPRKVLCSEGSEAELQATAANVVRCSSGGRGSACVASCGMRGAQCAGEPTKACNNNIEVCQRSARDTPGNAHLATRGWTTVAIDATARESGGRGIGPGRPCWRHAPGTAPSAAAAAAASVAAIAGTTNHSNGTTRYCTSTSVLPVRERRQTVTCRIL